MSDDDEDDKVRSNTGPEYRPQNVPTFGLGPRGSTGTMPGISKYERNALVNDIFVKEGDHLVGPYLMINTGRGQASHEAEPASPDRDNSDRVHFHETDDPEVNRFFQERGEVMVENPERRATASGHDPEIERLLDIARSDDVTPEEPPIDEGPDLDDRRPRGRDR